jgi:hypothetical protein
MTEATGPERLIIQNVTTVDGFAYGVIGADIHVLASGAPLYLLENWQPVPEVSPGWLRDMPGRMLSGMLSGMVSGRRATAPSTGDGELAQLELWRASAARLAVRWLYGPGGQGGSPLAGWFAAESAAAGWKVISAFHGPDAEPVRPGSQDARAAGSAGLLMIVEHTDRWLLTNLTWLLKNALLHQPGTATRVLMVARTADGWPRVRAILDTYQADTSSQHLPGPSRPSADRSGMSAAAPENFGAVFHISEVSSVPGLFASPVRHGSGRPHSRAGGSRRTGLAGNARFVLAGRCGGFQHDLSPKERSSSPLDARLRTGG